MLKLSAWISQPVAFSPRHPKQHQSTGFPPTARPVYPSPQASRMRRNQPSVQDRKILTGCSFPPPPAIPTTWPGKQIQPSASSPQQPPSRSTTPNHLKPQRGVPLICPLRRRRRPACRCGRTAPRLKGAWGPGQAPCRPHPAKGHPASEGRRLSI